MRSRRRGRQIRAGDAEVDGQRARLGGRRAGSTGRLGGEEAREEALADVALGAATSRVVRVRDVCALAFGAPRLGARDPAAAPFVAARSTSRSGDRRTPDDADGRRARHRVTAVDHAAPPWTSLLPSTRPVACSAGGTAAASRNLLWQGILRMCARVLAHQGEMARLTVRSPCEKR